MTEPIVSHQFVTVLWMLAKLVILAMLLERALYFVFDYRLWRDQIKGKGVRAPLALGAAWAICYWYRFDILATLLVPPSSLAATVNPSPFGIFVTAAVAAGGSAGAIVLFQDVLGFTRTAREDTQALQKERHAADLAQERARRRVAESEARQAEAQERKAKAEAKKAETGEAGE